MTSVVEIDRLVVSDDAVAARLWPRLGPRVRRAYLDDRDRWIALRRKVETGATLPPTTLAAEHKVFAGWARAFQAAGGPRKGAPTAKAGRRTPGPAATAAAATAAAASASASRANAVAAALSPASRVALSAPALTTAAQVNGSGGTAVAGGLVLAGLIAVAARRKRA
jgi:hypothetical protein